MSRGAKTDHLVLMSENIGDLIPSHVSMRRVQSPALPMLGAAQKHCSKASCTAVILALLIKPDKTVVF